MQIVYIILSGNRKRKIVDDLKNHPSIHLKRLLIEVFLICHNIKANMYILNYL